MRPAPGTRIRKTAVRLVAVACYIAAVAVAITLALPLFASPDSVAAPPPAAPAVEISSPERPEAAPKRIPEWAWGLYRWHDDKLGHQRPLDAPRRVPAWYWEWREWRAAVDAAKRTSAPRDA